MAAGVEDVANLVHDSVKDYYGKRVQKSEDLMTNCCTVDRSTFTSEAKEAMKQIHPEVLSKNYGCGAVYPEAVAGCMVLDLGSGAGLDCFVLSKMVGADGHVTGVDMTQEQIDISHKHVDYHTEVFGYSKPNVEFRHGYIERLGEVGIQDKSFDVVVSNCVVNLSPDKEAVLREVYRVLKTGGEFYFSDIYSSQPVPEAIQKDQVLWGECLAGALEWRELVGIAMEIGFAPPILVTSTLYKCSDPELRDMLSVTGCEDLQFCSATYRLMKVGSTTETGQVQNGTKTSEEKLVPIKYEGTVSGHAESLKFSCHNSLPAGMAVLVPESISDLLQGCPRLCRHFDFTRLAQGDSTSLTKSDILPLTGFTSLNPFEVANKSVELSAPKNLSSCCGAEDQPPAPKKLCCGGEEPAPSKEVCCGGGEPPPAKRSCGGRSPEGPSLDEQACCGEQPPSTGRKSSCSSKKDLPEL